MDENTVGKRYLRYPTIRIDQFVYFKPRGEADCFYKFALNYDGEEHRWNPKCFLSNIGNEQFRLVLTTTFQIAGVFVTINANMELVKEQLETMLNMKVYFLKTGEFPKD